MASFDWIMWQVGQSTQPKYQTARHMLRLNWPWQNQLSPTCAIRAQQTYVATDLVSNLHTPSGALSPRVSTLYAKTKMPFTFIYIPCKTLINLDHWSRKSMVQISFDCEKSLLPLSFDYWWVCLGSWKDRTAPHKKASFWRIEGNTICL